MKRLLSGLLGLTCAAAPVLADDAVLNDVCARAQYILDGESFGALPVDRSTADMFGAWFSYAPTKTDYVDVRVQGLPENTRIEIWEGCPAEGGRLVALGVGEGAPEASALLQGEAGAMYYFRIFDPTNKSGASFKLDVTPLDSPLDPVGGPGGVGADIIMSPSGSNPNIDQAVHGTFGAVGTTVSFILSSYTCNIGTANLAWTNRGTPYFGMNAFRYHNGRLVQVGIGHCKSACCVANGPQCGMTCVASGSGLRAGCRDVYSAGFNAGQGALAPRSIINAWTGVGTAIPAGTGNAVWRRMQLQVDDWSQVIYPGSIMYFEGVYACTDEIEANNTSRNNASYERVTWNGNVNSGSSVTRVGPTQVGVPAITAWSVNDPTVTNITADIPGEGRFHIAHKVTNLTGGKWLYDYAVYNLNSDRSADALVIPVPVGSSVTGQGFRDINYHSDEPYDNTDWNPIVQVNSVGWESPQKFDQNPNTNALRWGTMYNFWFESDYPPHVAPATLSLFKPGTPGDINPSVRQPRPVLTGDMNCDGVVNFDDIDGFILALTSEAVYEAAFPNCRWLGADTDDNGAVTFDDIDSFIDCLIAGGC